jgi:hypothetical protein
MKIVIAEEGANGATILEVFDRVSPGRAPVRMINPVETRVPHSSTDL